MRFSAEGCFVARCRTRTPGHLRSVAVATNPPVRWLLLSDSVEKLFGRCIPEFSGVLRPSVVRRSLNRVRFCRSAFDALIAQRKILSSSTESSGNCHSTSQHLGFLVGQSRWIDLHSRRHEQRRFGTRGLILEFSAFCVPSCIRKSAQFMVCLAKEA